MDYKKLLTYYFGRNFVKDLNNSDDKQLKVGGSKNDVTVNYWKFWTKETEMMETMSQLVFAFNTIYSEIEDKGIGVIADYDFNGVLIYSHEKNKMIDASRTVGEILNKRPNFALSFCSALHYGEVIIGNWGSEHRFKRMLLGASIDFCKTMADIGIEKEKKLILSKNLIIEIDQEIKSESLGRYGIVGVHNSELFSI